MGLADDLERIAALHRSGALSDAEFAQAKARCLAGGDASREVGGDAVGRWLRALRRSRNDRWFGGVCGGLAARSDVPAWLWRLVSSRSRFAAAPAWSPTCCSGSCCRWKTASSTAAPAPSGRAEEATR